MTDQLIENKNIVLVNIEDEMRGAYLDYAMSVILGRALPDVRDGLKHVHRRVLYAMYDLGNTYNKSYKKSARIVGDVIGKYHPHGDIPVYDTIVRMAQDFSLRYVLIDGQGNFGSVDGDAPAAMRYTEIRMAPITNELLEDIDRDTVNFVPNYDDSLLEPSVLPARIPNLLINGSTGIAVGMATNIPPHNLNEIISATLALIQNPNLDTDGILEYVQGPDFPTGAYLFGGDALKNAYRTGRGSVVLRSKVEIESWKEGRERILVSEIPYQVNKAKLIEKIAELVRDKRIEGISDLRDESDRTGMRIVIEVKKGENANIVLNKLYKLTQLQDTYSIILLGIHQNQPKVFNLRDLLWTFVEHRKDVVTRRTLFDLKKAEARAHLLEGLKRAVENLDRVIELIKVAKNPEEAKEKLKIEYHFTDLQVQAILEMRLQRLTGLERNKIAIEYGDVLKNIETLKGVLGNEKLIFEIIIKELQEIKSKYGDSRKTQIVYGSSGEFETEDLVSAEDTLVFITHSGYVKRSNPDSFRSQNRGGKGVRAVNTGEEDFVKAIYHCNTLNYLLCFTDQGKLYCLRVYQVPESTRLAKGKAIINLVALQPSEKIRAILPVAEFTDKEYVFLVTRAGIVKKTALSEFKNVRTNGLIAILIDDTDELVSAKLTNGNQDIFLCSRKGISVFFHESEVRAIGRSARGVMGMTLAKGDSVVAIDVLDSKDAAQHQNYEILTVTDHGYGKRTAIGEYRLTSRGCLGVVNIKLNEKTGFVMGCCKVLPQKDDVMLVSNKGKTIRLRVGEISESGRYAQGVRLISLAATEKLVSMEYIAEATSGVEVVSGES